jgi:hypothetical protein
MRRAAIRALFNRHVHLHVSAVSEWSNTPGAGPATVPEPGSLGRCRCEGDFAPGMAGPSRFRG